MAGVLGVIVAALLLSAPAAARAAEPSQPKGLSITPVRQFLTAETGTTTRNQFTVSNLTDNPLPVTFSVQQFSVADYTYNFSFNQPDNDWLRLGLTEAILQPGESRDIPFALDIPADGKPGGYYYTLLASAKLSAQGFGGTVQAADLLYVTVNGELTHTTRLDGSSIPRLSLGGDIAFTVQPRNTGNVHQFAFVTGELGGPSAKPLATSGAHLLMPGKVRTLGSSIPAPILPGIYRATIGYKTDTGQTVTVSRMVVVIQPWFVAVLLGVLLILGRFLTRPKRQAKKPGKPETINN